MVGEEASQDKIAVVNFVVVAVSSGDLKTTFLKKKGLKETFNIIEGGLVKEEDIIVVSTLRNEERGRFNFVKPSGMNIQ